MNLSEYIFSRGHPVYMPYLTVGDPSFEHTVEFGLAMIDVDRFK